MERMFIIGKKYKIIYKTATDFKVVEDIVADYNDVFVSLKNGKTIKIVNIDEYDLIDKTITEEPLPADGIKPKEAQVNNHAINSLQVIINYDYYKTNASKYDFIKTLKQSLFESKDGEKIVKDITNQLSKLNYAIKVNELDVKFSRIQSIFNEMINIIERQQEASFLLEIMSHILIKIKTPSSEVIRFRTTKYPIILLTDAYIYYMSNDIDKLKTTLSDYFEIISPKDDIINYNFYLSIGGEPKRDIKIIESTKANILESPEAQLKTYFDSRKYMDGLKYITKCYNVNPSESLEKLMDLATKAHNNFRKYPNMPNDDSFYTKALFARFIEEDYDKAIHYFKKTISTGEKKLLSAIMDCSDLIMHSKGNEEAIHFVKSNINHFNAPKERIKYFEKLSTLYSRLKDYSNQLSALHSLKNLYSSNKQVKNFLQVAKTSFRISNVYFIKGDTKNSLATCKEAMDFGHDKTQCLNHMINCYCRESQFDDALKILEENRNILDYYSIVSKINDLIQAEQSEQHLFDHENIVINTSDRFISFFEENYNLEGLAEGDFKTSKDKNFTDNDLIEVKNNYDNYKKTNPYDRGKIALTVAIIANELNYHDIGYFKYLALSLSLFAKGFLLDKKIDQAKSLFLYAVKVSNNLPNKKEKLLYIDYYLQTVIGVEFQRITYMTVEKHLQTLLIKLFTRKDINFYDIYKLLKESLEFQQYMQKIDEKTQNQLCELLKHKNQHNDINLMDSLLTQSIHYVNEVDKIYRESRTHLNLDFEKNYEIFVSKFLTYPGLLNTDKRNIETIKNAIDNFLIYKKRNDYDDISYIINKAINEFSELKTEIKKQPTIVSVNILYPIIELIEEKIQKKLNTITNSYEAQLSIDVPITSVDLIGKCQISITVSNKEFSSPARKIKITICSLDGESEYYKEDLTDYLKGGEKTSNLISFTPPRDDAFSINVILNYINIDDEAKTIEKPINISSSLKDFEMISNPYIAGNPISPNNDEVFYGRDMILSEIEKSLLNATVHSVVLYGQKRTGKSSIFKHLEKQVSQYFLTITIDFSNISSELEFYEFIKQQCLEKIDEMGYNQEINDLFSNITIENSFAFEKFLRKLKRDISKEKDILIMIDEFTHLWKNLIDNRFDALFMNKWKHFVETKLFKSIVIGQINMIDFINKYPNQFQISEPIQIKYLDANSSIQLITNPIKTSEGQSRFVENSEKAIYNWFIGQPFYIQSYCHELVDYLNRNKQSYVTLAIAQNVKNSLIQKQNIGNSFIDNVLDIYGNGETNDVLTVLLKIAHQTRSLEWCIFNDFEEHDKEIISVLLSRDILTQQSNNINQKYIKITMPFLKDFLLATN
jgi:pentatricopeptide repeat protein